MAETTEKEKQERRSSITDADFIPHSEAPKMPRVFSNADMTEQKEPLHRSLPVSVTVMLCAVCLMAGMWLGSRESGETSAPAVTNPPEEVLSLPSATAALSADNASGDSPRLGVAVQTVSAAAAEFYELYYGDKALEGVQICAVGEDSSAERAGLLPGDIILCVNGEAVPTAEHLSAAENRCKAGDEALCTVFREGKLLELPVVLEEAPADTELNW